MALLAEGILKLHWDQTVPVNIAHIVKSMGVRLSLEDSVPCSARLSITAGNHAQLQLSRQLPHLHQRYVVAHALAHVALHHLRPGMQRELHLSEDFRLDFGVPHNLEANDFALRLLMPEPALRYAVEQMRPRDRSAAELAGLLADQSGIGALRELLRTQFGARAQVLKARSALATVKALAEATPSTEARHLTDRIHDVELSAHEFVEIRMLQVLQTKPALAAALDVRAAARVLGGDGPAAWQRLDIAPGSSDDDIETVARDEIERWRAAVHQDDFGGRDRRDVAEAVVRSLEGIVDEVARPG